MATYDVDAVAREVVNTLLSDSDVDWLSVFRSALRSAYDAGRVAGLSQAGQILTEMAAEDRRIAASPETYDDEAEERRQRAYRLDQARERIRALPPHQEQA